MKATIHTDARHPSADTTYFGPKGDVALFICTIHTNFVFTVFYLYQN